MLLVDVTHILLGGVVVDCVKIFIGIAPVRLCLALSAPLTVQSCQMMACAVCHPMARVPVPPVFAGPSTASGTADDGAVQASLFFAASTRTTAVNRFGVEKFVVTARIADNLVKVQVVLEFF